MPNGLLNWKFSDVEKFLKKRSFILNHTRGSHYYYTGYYNKETRQVCVPFHGSKTIKPRTMRSIVVQSGIPPKEWVSK